MLALYLNFAFICLVSSVLGRPARLIGNLKARVEPGKSSDGNAWKPLYDGHETFVSEMKSKNPGLLENLADKGQRMPNAISLCSKFSHLKQILTLW